MHKITFRLLSFLNKIIPKTHLLITFEKISTRCNFNLNSFPNDFYQRNQVVHTKPNVRESGYKHMASNWVNFHITISKYY